ncbi:MAG: penicillin-binding protein 2 [Caldimicrobium sp.]
MFDKWQKKERLDEEWEKRFFYGNLLLFIILGILWIRLFYLQVVKHSYYLNKAKMRSIVSYVIKAPRGEIITADGVVVATNRASFQLYLDLENLRDEEEILKKLSLILKEDYGSLKERFYLAKKVSYGRVLLKRNLTWDEVARIMVRQYYLPGVIVEVEAERFYPYGEAYFHLLGYVGRINKEEYENLKNWGYSPEDFIGKKGIERLYERYLKGVNGRLEIERDAYGRLGKVVGRTSPIPGEDIVLTVRHDLQMKAYELLKDKRGAVVALSPKDGALLALVSMPSIDPNKFITGFEEGEWSSIINDPKRPLLNRAIQAYPPGSTFKIITALAGLEAGIVKGPNWSVYCPGYFPFGSHIFRCWERKGHGTVGLKKAIAQSCDVYFYIIGAKIEIDFLANVARRFGLGSLTGINFPDEKEGLIPDRSWKQKRFKLPWYPGETVNISIGQGYLLVTPLQMARAYMALANGGYLYKIYALKGIHSKKGKILYQEKLSLERKIEVNENFYQWVLDGLKSVVEDGTGKAARVPGITVWGKTGTAQVVSLRKKTKLMEHHAWFVSFAGNSTPEIVSAVLVEHGGSGGAVAAPIAGELYRTYYKLPPALPKSEVKEEIIEEVPEIEGLNNSENQNYGENSTF